MSTPNHFTLKYLGEQFDGSVERQGKKFKVTLEDHAVLDHLALVGIGRVIALLMRVKLVPHDDVIPSCIAELTRRLKAKGDVTHMDDEWKALQRAVDALKAVEALNPKSAPSA